MRLSIEHKVVAIMAKALKRLFEIRLCIALIGAQGDVYV